MTICKNLAAQLHAVYFGGNWTCSCYREQLADLKLAEVITTSHSLNNIATLTCHATYYVRTLTTVLKEKALTGKDADSFVLPPLTTQEEWDQWLKTLWTEAAEAARCLETCDDEILLKPFVNETYGTYYRNISGIIEHLHYHLGQIALLKNLLRTNQSTNP